MSAGWVRPPAVAGLFYPADPGTLHALVEASLEEAAPTEPGGAAPKAIVAPHAGYRYSGPIAASAYARLRPLAGSIERVVVLGPAHTVPLAAIATSSADAFQTPLGPVALDTAGRDRLVAASLAVVDDRAHAAEHSLEVQLPFLQLTLGELRLLPLVVGRVSSDAVTAVLDDVWGGPETVLVLSTDLSHYHEHRIAQQLDRQTAEHIVGCQADALGAGDACGVYGLRGLLVAAGAHGLEGELLDLRTSADTAGEPDRVVGYGAFAFR